MIEHGSSAPRPLDDKPAHSIVSAERGCVQLLVRFRHKQRPFASIAPQLVGDEFGPIRKRTMHGARRAHHLGVVDRWTIARKRLTSKKVRPRLVNLAWCSKSPKTRASHAERLEYCFGYKIFPRLPGDFFGDCSRQHISDVRILILRSRR